MAQTSLPAAGAPLGRVSRLCSAASLATRDRAAGLLGSDSCAASDAGRDTALGLTSPHCIMAVASAAGPDVASDLYAGRCAACVAGLYTWGL